MKEKIEVLDVTHAIYFQGARDARCCSLDKKTLKRLQELKQLDEDKKKTLYDLIDTYIRDDKARKAYA